MSRLTGVAAVMLLAACAYENDPVAPTLSGDSTASTAVALDAPSNVRAFAESSTRITVRWTDNAVTESGFEVYRSPDGNPGTFVLLVAVAATARSHADSGLTRATQYCYQVRAVRDRGPNTAYSAFSATACATTGPGASLTVMPESAFVIAGGRTGFRVEVRNDMGFLVVPAEVTWTTGNPAVATVSTTGDVTGVARGRADITATSAGMSDAGHLSVISPLRITTITTGIDIDANGYYPCWDGGCASQLMGVNDAVSYGLVPGDHLIELAGVAANCAVSGEYPRRVNINPDQDAVVAFEIVCSPRETLAFVSWQYCYDWWCGYDYIPYIALGFTNESPEALLVANATEPAWSPDGRFLAFTSSESAIKVVDVGTGTVTTLSQHPTPAWSPHWKPDGSRIAFASYADGRPELYVMNSDGSNAVRLTNNVGFFGSPAWSPNGAQIAFDCRIESGNDDVCVINADGSGLTRLTSEPGRDGRPAWSPDGRKIAFETSRYGTGFLELVVMNPDGTGVTRLAPGVMAEAPAWSPDGSRLAFSDSYWQTVAIIRSNGTGLVNPIFWNASDPAWKPRTP